MLLVSNALFVQSPADVQRAAQTILPAHIRRRIGIIADDSMRGRDTPSAELDKVAAYIGREYRRLGLTPGGNNGTFIQRYSLDRVQVVAESSVAFVHGGGGGGGATMKYGKDFVFSDNNFESGDYAGGVVLVTGPLTGPLTADTATFAGKIVIFASPRFRDRQRLFAWKPAGVVLLTSADDSDWSRIVSRRRRPQSRDPNNSVGGPILLMRMSSFQPIVAQFGLDLAGAQSAAAFEARPLGDVQLHVHARMAVREKKSAPNVVAILEGSDPTLKNEYVVFSAHMDHIGVAGPRGSGSCQAEGADSICNGADDDGSGTAAVVEIAEAFSGLRPRPQRSIIFLNVSGEEKGLWGSQYFVDHPTVPITSMVADLNIDMIGRNWKDTIVAIGKEHSDLGATLNRVAAAHRELNMQPIDDKWPGENFYGRSDHFNFAKKGVPILFFFSGTHIDYHKVGDSPDKIDAEKESRVAQLIFYLGLDVANSAERPKWNPDSYKRIVSAN